MEIVTWVLSGELEHTDTTGAHDVIRPGMAQRMSAGTGVRHSEMNASATLPVHFVQMWVMPDTEGVPPSYEQVDVSDQLERGELVAVASGVPGRAAVTIHQERATLWAARLPTGRIVEIPAAEHAHLFVARGSAGLGEAGDLVQGDAVRLTDAGALPLESRSDDTEILLWQMG
jgi:redox-sensitive bicupin YhaK (pirin superfamily)